VAVTQWWLLEAGPRARSLVIEYRQGDSCSFPATATVRETSIAIRVALRQPVYLPGPGEGCLDYLKFSRLTVTLHSAVAGRHVVQPASGRFQVRPRVIYLTRTVPDPPYSDAVLPLVPRVTGLSPTDATRVLQQAGFHVIVHGHGTEVTRQSPHRDQPAPGTDAAHPFAGVVHLFTRSA
jgi:hypothetical protein